MENIMNQISNQVSTIRQREHIHTEFLAHLVDTLELKLFPVLALPATTRFSLNFLNLNERV